VLGNYGGSVKSFKELIKDYPNSSYADEAQLRIGEIYEILIENYASAEKEYESLLINYPNSIYVDETRKRIRTLKNKQ
jgi:outer membrane protein assembly factor BamD (BamD/ComL family)